eukprot:9679-Alexandrium_andersonii.AAC.1
MRDIQRWVHAGAVNFLEVSGNSGRLARAARGCGLRTAEAVGPGEIFEGCDWKPGDAVDKELAWP